MKHLTINRKPNYIYYFISLMLPTSTILFLLNFLMEHTSKDLHAQIITFSSLSIATIIIVTTLYFIKNGSLIKELKHQNETIENLSILDPLTQVYNKRYFDDILNKEIKVSKRYQTPLLFLLCDLDSFKSYHETHGNKKTNELLIKITQLLQNKLNRPEDYMFKIAEDKFVILMKNMPYDAACKFALNLQSSIEQLQIKHPHNPASIYVTLSMGLTYLSKSGVYNEDDIYKCTDKTLLHAKSKGRNKLVCYNVDEFGTTFNDAKCSIF